MALASAKLFVEEGAYVFITGRKQKQLDEAVLTEPIPGTHRIISRFAYLLSRYLAMFPSRLYGITAITGRA
jgi:hypothetical protein